MIRVKNPNYTARLSNEYQEVEYLESTGLQYIDTGVGITTALSFECEWAKTMTGAGLNGSYYFVSSTTKAFCFGLYADNKLYVGVGSTTNTATAGSLNTKYKTVGNSTSMTTYENDVSKVSITGTLAANNLNFYLFAAHRNQGTVETGYYGQYKIYTCKLYENNILVRNFVPCYRKIDNVPGLYDIINNTFYENQGTGTFLIGSEVNKKDINIKPKITKKLFSYSLNKKYVGNKVIYNRENDEDQEINYTYLYDYGNECTDITGGWSGTTYSTGAAWAKNTNHLYMKSYRASVYTLKAIDLTDYTYMIAVTETRGRTTTAYSSQIFYSNTTISASSGTISAGSWPNATSFNVNINGGAPYNFFIPIKESLRNSRYLAVSSDDSASLGYINLYNMTIFKEDDCSKLAELIGLANDSIENIINHSKYLLNNEEAVRYMVKHYTGDFMARALGSEKFLLALESSPYKTIVHANKHWNQFLTMLI